MYEALKALLPPQVAQWSSRAALVRDTAALAAAKLPANQLYCLPQPEAELFPFVGRCRLVLGTKAQLQTLQTLCQDAGYTRPLSVGLFLRTDSTAPPYGFSVSQLPALSAFVRTLPLVSVAGCLAGSERQGMQGDALDRFFPAAYQAAKTMSAVLPCSMPYLGLCNGLFALEACRLHDPDTLSRSLLTLRTVAMQNETAFYARLLLF